MSVVVTHSVLVTTVETIETGIPAAAADNAKITHSLFNKTPVTLNASSTPPATKCAFFTQALTAGAATIDLTALPGTNGATIDMTGLKVQVFRVIGNGNANPITLTEGAANGYELAGNAWKGAVNNAQELTFYGNDSTPDVSPTAKDIDLSGTGVQSVKVAVIAG